MSFSPDDETGTAVNDIVGASGLNNVSKDCVSALSASSAHTFIQSLSDQSCVYGLGEK